MSDILERACPFAGASGSRLGRPGFEVFADRSELTGSGLIYVRVGLVGGTTASRS